MSPKELLLKVKKHVLEEPLRLNMAEGLILNVNDIKDVEEYDHAGVPPCGTVGCIAGWCCVLSYGINTSGPEPCWYDIRDSASELLGMSFYGPVERLFYPGQWPAEFKERLKDTTPGTSAYAAVVADRIDAFILEQGL